MLFDLRNIQLLSNPEPLVLSFRGFGRAVLFPFRKMLLLMLQGAAAEGSH
jgi:hypothetical protein